MAARAEYVGQSGLARAVRLGELARLVGGELYGPAGRTVRGVAALGEAGPGELSFICSPRSLARAEASAAAALIVPQGVSHSAKPIIRVANPRLAFAQALALFHPPRRLAAGVHPAAAVAEGAQLGESVAVGALAVVCAGASLGARVQVHPLAYVGERAQVGEDSVLFPHVVIGERVQLGRRVIVHAGAVIGADGFGYAQDAQGRHLKMPQVGTVVIEDDVEIGANSTVDRATLEASVIGRGTKIDDHVHIAHNVVIGEDCIIAGLTGISGSTQVGDRVFFGGQAGVADRLVIGADSRILARAGVTSSLPPGSVVSGMPARPRTQQLRAAAAARRLPELVQRVAELERRVRELEQDRGR